MTEKSVNKDPNITHTKKNTQLYFPEENTPFITHLSHYNT